MMSSLSEFAARGQLLAKIKDTWGFSMASEDYQDVIEAGMDICLVSSPHGLHYEHAKAALQAGAHVLCEKPFVLNPHEAWELVDIAKQNDLHLLVSYGWNYQPWVRETRRLMAERSIGEIEQSTIHMASTTRELLFTGGYPAASPEAMPEAATWIDPRNGGGYGQAQLSHALGLALWLTDLRGDAVFALMTAPLNASVEFHDAATIRYTNGSIGTMSGGSCHLGAGDNRHQVEVRAIGSDGQMAIDLERDFVWFWRADGEEVRPPLASDTFVYDCDGPRTHSLTSHSARTSSIARPASWVRGPWRSSMRRIAAP